MTTLPSPSPGLAHASSPAFAATQHARHPTLGQRRVTEPTVVLSSEEASTWLLATGHGNAFGQPLETASPTSPVLRPPRLESKPASTPSTAPEQTSKARRPRPDSADAPQLVAQTLVQTPPPRTAAPRPTRRETEPPKQNTQSSPADSESRSVSLAVPYANTSPSTQPKLGDRPLQARKVENGVSKHARTSTPPTSTEVVGARSGRRFTLLNPVNLLMRRRSQFSPTANAENRKTPPSIPPMTLPADYDPRIRGSVVHDFSAPRSRDTPRSSFLALQTRTELKPQDTNRPSSVNENGSPNAKVKAKADIIPPAIDVHDRGAEVEDSQPTVGKIVTPTQTPTHRTLQTERGEIDPDTFPPPRSSHSQHADFQQFRRSIGEWQARKADPSSAASSPSEISSLSQLPSQRNRSQHSSASPVVAAQDRISSPRSQEQDSACLSRSSSFGSDPQDLVPDTSTSAAVPGLPKHFKSNASRFSFQMAGSESHRQEMLLEELAKRKLESSPKLEDQRFEEDEEEYFDEDAMYDADELEEQGTGLGLELGSSPPVQMTSFVSPLPQSAQAPLPDPRSSSTWADSGAEQLENQASDKYGGAEKRIDSHQEPTQNLLTTLMRSKEERRGSRASHDFDDEMYFNDAIEIPRDTREDYDERGESKDVQDDDDTAFEVEHDDDPPSRRHTIVAATVTHPEIDEMFIAQQGSAILAPDTSMLVTPALGIFSLPPETQASLLLQNEHLAAYHSALANAAQKAASDGKFSRTDSTMSLDPRPSLLFIDPNVREQDIPISTKSNLRDHRHHDSYSGFDFGFNDHVTTSAGTPMSSAFPVDTIRADGELEDGFGDEGDDDAIFDELENDEAIISEANAEVLASDEEGFYGREFGFYAKARSGNDNVECVNGGYFGVRGEATIERKYSVKEPNLTPITERSELSTRNSFAGGPWTPTLNSPAFAAQLARMSPVTLAHLQEDDMVMEQMLRLRSAGFFATEGTGRSSPISISSLSSVGLPGPRSLTHRVSWTTAPGNKFVAKGVAPILTPYSLDNNSIPSARISRSYSDTGKTDPTQSPMADSPISTHSMRTMGHSGPFKFPETPRKGLDMDLQTPPTAVKSSPRMPRTHVRSNSAGGDSVTYTKEKDEFGNDSWMLERRRMNEHGIMELVGRELVRGGI